MISVGKALETEKVEKKLASERRVDSLTQFCKLSTTFNVTVCNLLAKLLVEGYLLADVSSAKVGHVIVKMQ